MARKGETSREFVTIPGPTITVRPTIIVAGPANPRRAAAVAAVTEQDTAAAQPCSLWVHSQLSHREPCVTGKPPWVETRRGPTCLVESIHSQSVVSDTEECRMGYRNPQRCKNSSDADLGVPKSNHTNVCRLWRH